MPSVLKTVFLSLNSHIFFFVVDQCQRRQRQASKNADVCSAFEPQLSSRNRRCKHANEFIRSSLAAKAFTSCPNELRTSKSYLRAIPTIFFYLSLLKVFTPKHPFVRVVNTRRFNSGFTRCNLLFTISAEPLIGLIDIGIQLEVIQDLPLITDQEYSSHYRRKIRALYAKVHLNISRKVQPSFNFVYGLWL